MLDGPTQRLLPRQEKQRTANRTMGTRRAVALVPSGAATPPLHTPTRHVHDPPLRSRARVDQGLSPRGTRGVGLSLLLSIVVIAVTAGRRAPG